MKTKNSSQVGGNHYDKMEIEPVELMVKLKLNWFQGEVLKYISRDKNGIEDLHKAIQVCYIAKTMGVVNDLDVSCLTALELIKEYCDQFMRLDYDKFTIVQYMMLLEIVTAIAVSNWDVASNTIVQLRDSLYGSEEG